MRDIIVIGAPVGGAAALLQLAGRFPPDLEASVFVVLHATPENPILLADVLNAPGRMRAADVIDGEAIERRRIYVAADGKHLLMRDGRAYLSANGTEHPHRPSIDVLFTSAAEAYNARVIGVLLLHAREDGSRGLHAIRKAGGRTIAHRNEQMPEKPRHPETSEELAHDHLEIDEIAPRLVAYVNGVNGNDFASSNDAR
jgi:two-component system chemotaxis response regulator CheB